MDSIFGLKLTKYKEKSKESSLKTKKSFTKCEKYFSLLDLKHFVHQLKVRYKLESFVRNVMIDSLNAIDKSGENL